MRRRVGRVLAATTASVLLTAAASPATIGAVYCRQMGILLSHPCCGRTQVKQDAPTASSQIDRQPCCTAIRLILEKPAGERLTQPDRPLAPTIWTGLLPLEATLTGSFPVPGCLAVVHLDSGPPMLRRVCSLLI